MRRWLAAVAAVWTCGAAWAQVSEYTLTEQGQWKETAREAPGPDAEVIARARRALADDRPQEARDILTPWIEENRRSGKAEAPEALLLRADAYLAMDSETKALYDLEELIKRFPQSEQYVSALERELAVAVAYVHGKRRKFLGMRIEHAGDMGVEMLIRVQERLPGSALAERAAIEMADYYFRRREMDLAAQSYELYMINYPNGPNRMRAMERRIYSTIARFKGPENDASGLIDAREQIRSFAMQYPAHAERTGLDASLLARLDESAAAQMLSTARWYERTGDAPSARLTLGRLLEKHPRTAAAREAAALMRAKGWLEEAAAPEVIEETAPAEAPGEEPAADESPTPAEEATP